MAFQPAPGVARVQCEYTLDGQICMNVLHAHHEAATWTVGELTLLASAFSGWVADQVLPAMASAVTARQVVARDLSSETAPSVIDVDNLGDPGGIISEPMPNQCALVVSLLSATGGRTGRGRVYHLGLTESVCVGNKVTSAYRDQVRAAYDALLTIAGASPWSWVILSRVSGGVPRPEGIPRFILATGVDLQIDSQDRRTPGHGS